MSISKQAKQNPIGEFGATGWWENDGAHALLHVINPVRFAYVQERCGSLAGKRVADVGCGGGIFSVALAEAGADVIGIDTAATALSTARAQVAQRALPATFKCMDAATLAREGESEGFDIVVCMEMLEHVEDPASEIRALSSLLRQGGDLFVATINRTLFAHATMIIGLERCLGVLPAGSHRHEAFLTPDEVASWCRKAGLQVADIVGMNWSFFGKTFLLSRTRMPVNYVIHALRK